MSQLLKGTPTSGPGSGTVTSISAGEGITLTPNPITTTGTVALTVPVSIADGGTNATAMSVTDGTVYFDGTRLVTTATGTSGQFLKSNGAGVAPAYATLPASSISITGDSGGALTGSSFTFTGGTSGLTFAGAGTTETLGGTLAIANGGTNAASMAHADGVVYYDGTRLVTTAVGSSTQVLTSNGAGMAPTFQNASGGSITITGDSGGGLTGTSFTFTGGSTGLTFAGAGSTETLGGTLAIANGGTDATSFTQSNGIVTYNGTRLVNYAGPQLSSAGIQTNTTQPAFSVLLANTISNVTGDGTNYTVVFDTVLKDQGSNYNVGTGVYTVPTTGLYMFTCAIMGSGITTQNFYQITLVTTARNYTGYYAQFPTGGASGFMDYPSTWVVPMTAGDTASFQFQINGGVGGKTVSVYPNFTFAGGFLIC